MVAQHLAICHPELVERLVLNCTSPGGPLRSYPLEESAGLPAAERTELSLSLMDTRCISGSGGALLGLEGFTSQLRDTRSVGFIMAGFSLGKSRFTSQLRDTRSVGVSAVVVITGLGGVHLAVA